MAMEDDDDEFGDLYTDVLRPVAAVASFPSSTPTSSLPAAVAFPNSCTVPPSEAKAETASSPAIEAPLSEIRESDPGPGGGLGGAKEEDWILGPAPITEEEQGLDWKEDEEVAAMSRDSRPPVSRDAGTEEEGGGAGSKDEGDGEAAAKLEVEDEIEGFDQEAVIPGLAGGPLAVGGVGEGFGGNREAEGDDWDSDSGDDLQIVLNDDGIDRRGSGVRSEGVGAEDDDEDGEDDLVIVADEGQLHHHHQVMEEQDWGEEAQSAVEGEKKDASEVTKGSVGAIPGRVGFGSHGFHPHHHSQFKYVRPGAASGPGGAPSVAGGTSQNRPFTMGPTAGRGRGLQRGFQPSYGLPSWANSSSAKHLVSGLEFTLPSHKTIFDVDIDSFEEKPWKHVGVDVSDFFNFELDEDSWKEYCKQLEQLRLESTMQSKIRVYESGRSEQGYDPDLPPELAAASGLQDSSTEIPHVRKVDPQSDLIGQGRGTPWMRPQLPTGRAIQVETSTVERLPTIDTRHPRYRESDAIIEIVPQGSLDEAEQPENGVVDDEYMGGYEGKEKGAHDDPKYNGQFPMHSGKKDSVSRELHSAHNGVPERDGILPFPPETTTYYPPPKLRNPSSAGEGSGRNSGRQSPEKQERDSGASDEFTNDDQSTHIERNQQKQKSDVSGEANKNSETFPTAVHAEQEASIENADSEHGDQLDFADSTEEREGMMSDSQCTGDNPEDGTSSNSHKKQKLNSQVEQSADLNSGDGGVLRNMIANNTREKSGSGNDYLRHAEGCGVENTKDARDRSFGVAVQHPHNKHSFRQIDNSGRGSRHELDRSRTAHRVKDSLHHTQVDRDLDNNRTQHTLEVDGSEKQKERDSSGNFFQKREVQMHGRKAKDGDPQMRKEEMGSRHRKKVRVNERKGGGEDLHIRKQHEEGYWRDRHDREAGPQKREGGEILSSRENLDDIHSSRKDEEYHRKEKVGKEILPGHRARIDNQSKKERVDDADPRRKDSLARVRDKTMDHHFSGHRDGSRRHREREDRKRSKQAREDIRGHRERGGGNIERNFPVSENKLHEEVEKTKNGSKSFNSDKDPVRGRHNEQSKGRGPAETHSRHKGHQESHASGSQYSSEMKSYRNGRSNSHIRHSLNSDKLVKEKHRNNTRRSKEPQAKQSSVAPSKRKHEDSSVYENKKVHKSVPSDDGMKNVNGRESTISKEHYHGDQKQETAQEERAASDDENQQESRRGRSKLERWASHVERESTSTNQSGLNTSRNVEVNNTNTDAPKTIVHKSDDLDNKDANVVQVSDKESDRHLETVEKLKKRSERFKLPMPVDDTPMIKKVENDVPVIQNDTPADSGIKQERPARKRRWGSS